LSVDALAADGKTALDKGKVVVIDNQVDQTTGTVKVKGEFPNANLQLWPGQFVNVRLLIDTLHNVIVVPTAAIQRGPNGTFVYVIKDDSTVTARRVTLAQQDDKTERARIHLKAAIAYYDEARYEDAAREMEAAYQLKPLPDLQYNLAQCYERMGRYDDAAKAYESYLACKPEAPDKRQVMQRIDRRIVR